MAELNGTGHTAEMAEGERSQFDVFADGKLIFSKQSEGSFPEIAELLPKL